AVRTRSAVVSEAGAAPVNARDAVDCETPARSATSRIVTTDHSLPVETFPVTESKADSPRSVKRGASLAVAGNRGPYRGRSARWAVYPFPPWCPRRVDPTARVEVGHPVTAGAAPFRAVNPANDASDSAIPECPGWRVRRRPRGLAECAAELRVEIRHGHELTGRRQHADIVTVDVPVGFIDTETGSLPLS